MSQIDSDFEIKSEYIDKALEAVKRLASSDSVHRWVNNRKILESETLKEAVREWCWELYGDRGNDIIGISFNGEKSDDEEFLFEVLAPYITNGSFIEMSGEEGMIWRWIFRDGKYQEIYPTIIWED